MLLTFWGYSKSRLVVTFKYNSSLNQIYTFLHLRFGYSKTMKIS